MALVSLANAFAGLGIGVADLEEQGALLPDLSPSNIGVDGSGKVRIFDLDAIKRVSYPASTSDYANSHYNLLVELPLETASAYRFGYATHAYHAESVLDFIRREMRLTAYYRMELFQPFFDSTSFDGQSEVATAPIQIDEWKRVRDSDAMRIAHGASGLRVMGDVYLHEMSNDEFEQTLGNMNSLRRRVHAIGRRIIDAIVVGNDSWLAESLYHYAYCYHVRKATFAECLCLNWAASIPNGLEKGKRESIESFLNHDKLATLNKWAKGLQLYPMTPYHRLWVIDDVAHNVVPVWKDGIEEHRGPD